MKQSALTDYQGDDEPWKDDSWLREKCHDEGMTTVAIAEQYGVPQSTVYYWMDKHGVEPHGGATVQWGAGNAPVPYAVRTDGYVCWRHGYKGESYEVLVHRLLAVAEYGVDAVADMDVHHINGHPFDNRPSNIELKSRGEHIADHRRIPTDDLLAALRRLDDELDKDLCAHDMRKHGDYSERPYIDRFGSFDKAKEAAGMG